MKRKEVCPKCRKEMVHIAKSIYVCPYCGKGIDKRGGTGNERVCAL